MNRFTMELGKNILDHIGNTPLVELQRMTDADSARIIVKFEGLNVGGSIKTRTAFNMIEAAERDGILAPDSIIVEPTSGNQGIGLALVGAIKGYRVILIMPDSVSVERMKLVKHYGAEVIMINDDGDIGECIRNCLEKAMELERNDPKVFIPQQFENPNNPEIHRIATAQEILAQLDGEPVHAFCSGIGTGGTLTGIGEVLRMKYPDIYIAAVEPENAAILSGGNIGTHIQMGIGDGLIPANLNTAIYDDVYIISDEEAVKIARDLARLEGLAGGITSGTNTAAAIKIAKKLGRGKTVLTILPDTAERYFSTPLFEQDGMSI